MGEDREKQEAMDRARRHYTDTGNLTEAEIEELLDYDFGRGTVSVREQVRRYFLLLKLDSPSKAARLLEAAEPLLRRGVDTEQEVHDLCVVLVPYVRDVVIDLEPTEEMRDEMTREYPLPLKTLTLKAVHRYRVWRYRRSEWVLWKAWRQGRPMVCGYGMTEEEAIDDLRYVVSPDHDGTLDGLGVPKGPAIGGNTLFPHQILEHNRSRFTS